MTRQLHACSPRKRFDYESQARMACIRIAETQKVQRYPEACGKCSGWHLSRDPNYRGGGAK